MAKQERSLKMSTIQPTNLQKEESRAGIFVAPNNTENTMDVMRQYAIDAMKEEE